MKNQLWKVRISPPNTWQPEPEPMYVTAPTKEKAKAYTEKHLESPYKVGKISQLGEKLSGRVFVNSKSL